MRIPLLLPVLLLCARMLTAQQPAPHRSVPASSSSLNGLLERELSARAVQMRSVQTRADALIRQAEVRRRMLRLIGPLPAKTPLDAQVLGETRLPGIRIQKIVFESQPGFYVTALLYLPDSTLVSGRLPAILMAPGHGASGKAGDAPFALAFARQGFAVLSYDPLGQGERLQYPDLPAHPDTSLAGASTGEHGEAGIQPVLLGESLAKYFLFDGIRAIDYLQSRPEIDPARIGAFGCSGGGADTALLGAIDQRLAAIGTACYLTSFATLLPAIGPQDAEQSTPNWIASGLDFPDYVEAAAPRPYAIIATEADMFPFAGAQSAEKESRTFYDLFDADRELAFITGPGGHGNLRPILPRIVQFFTEALHPSLISPIYDGQSAPLIPPPGALQVTGTGQVATSYPGSATVFTLNQAYAAGLSHPHPQDLHSLQVAVRAVLYPNETTRSLHPSPTAFAQPADELADGKFCLASAKLPEPAIQAGAPAYTVLQRRIQTSAGELIAIQLSIPNGPGPCGLALQLLDPSEDRDPAEARAATDRLVASRHIVLSFSPAPVLPRNAETKSSLLGPYYLLGLRAELLGSSILALRTDQVLAAAGYLSRLSIPHTAGIAAEAEGHMALVLLHAAVLDPGLTRLTVSHLPPTYAQVLANPLPRDTPPDLLPGVLLRYDLPDLLAILTPRLRTTPSPQFQSDRK